MKAVLARINLLGLATIVVCIAIWEAMIASGAVRLTYLPSPVSVGDALGHLAMNGDLWGSLEHTVIAALEGWVAAAVVGTILGITLAIVRPAWRYSMATIEVLRAIPIIAFVPVSILLFGFSTEMEVILAFYAALWPIVINTVTGVAGTDAKMIDAGRALHLGPIAQIWSLRLPHATPIIMVGLRLGLALSLVLVIVSEMVGNPAGIGYAIVQAGQSLHPSEMLAYIIVVGLVGLGFNGVLVAVARLLFPCQMAAGGDVG